MDSFPKKLNREENKILIGCSKEADNLSIVDLTNKVKNYADEFLFSTTDNYLMEDKIFFNIKIVTREIRKRWTDIPVYSKPWLKGALYCFLTKNFKDTDSNLLVSFEKKAKLINSCLELAGLNDLIIKINKKEFSTPTKDKLDNKAKEQLQSANSFLMKCPSCYAELKAPEKYLGYEVACPDCDYSFILMKDNRTFTLKCPKCGVFLEADEQIIGMKVSCPKCDYHFILEKDIPVSQKHEKSEYPDMLEDIDIQNLVFTGLKLVTTKPNFNPKVLDTLQSYHIPKIIFNIDFPVFVKVTEDNVKSEDYKWLFKKPIMIFGEEYSVCNKWNEGNRAKFIKWIQNFDVNYNEFKEACNNTENITIDNKSIQIDTERKTECPAEKKAKSTLSFQKRVDWSTFHSGITIPYEYHTIVKQNLTEELIQGQSLPIMVKISDQEFQARILSPKFSNFSAKPVIQILWSENSPIAKYFQSAYKEIYEALLLNKKDRNVLKEKFEVRSTSKKDSFEFVLNSGFYNNPEDDIEKCTDLSSDSDKLHLLKAAIEGNYHDGFDFSANALLLIESRIKVKISSSLIELIKKQMFQRHDGLFFFVDVIMENSIKEKFINTAVGWICEHGMFCTTALYKQFDGRFYFLDSQRSRSDFLKWILANNCKIPVEFTRSGSKQVCRKKNVKFETLLIGIADQVRSILKEKGDAVKISEIIRDLSYLCGSYLSEVCNKFLPEAMIEDIDSEKAFKIIDSYYLPDDFDKNILEIIAMAGKNRISTGMIYDFLGTRYGGDFEEDYAVNDGVLKQLVDYVCRDKASEIQRKWNGNFFISKQCNYETGKKGTLLCEFLNQTRGIFHEIDFFEFAKNNGYTTSNYILITNFLQRSCIRLDEQRWLSKDQFKKSTNWEQKLAGNVSVALQKELENSPFISLGLISQQFLDNLPEILFERKRLNWTGYLLVSVVKHYVDGYQLLNDEVAPYVITAMLLPETAKAPEDAVSYAIDVYKDRMQYSSLTEEDVFAFLKKNQIRMRLSKKLREIIRKRIK